MGIWALVIFVIGILVPVIDNWGHGGGIVAGAILGFLLGYEEKRRETFWQRALAWGCIVMTILVLVWAVLTAVFYRMFG